MQIEVLEHFGIKKYFRDADFFETDTAKRLFKQLKKIIPEGQLIALTGVVGIGKTTYLERIQKQLAVDKKVIVAKSLSVEKSKTNLTTLITALFYDVSGDNDSEYLNLVRSANVIYRNSLRRVKSPLYYFVMKPMTCTTAH